MWCGPRTRGRCAPGPRMRPHSAASTEASRDFIRASLRGSADSGILVGYSSHGCGIQPNKSRIGVSWQRRPYIGIHAFVMTYMNAWCDRWAGIKRSWSRYDNTRKLLASR